MLRVQRVKTSDTTSDNEWQRVVTIRITHEIGKASGKEK